jgi:hypothetical protein
MTAVISGQSCLHLMGENGVSSVFLAENMN